MSKGERSMTFEKAKREFKMHYKKATKLKEGGKAWEREISQANRYKNIATTLYQLKWERRY